MSSSTCPPDHGRRQSDAQHAGRKPEAEKLWPRAAEDGHPLGWWRMLPPHLFGDAERLLVTSALEGLAVIGGGKDLAAALQGDVAAAIAVALSRVPLREVTLQTDIAMTGLLRCALKDDPAAVLENATVRGASWSFAPSDFVPFATTATPRGKTFADASTTGSPRCFFR